MNCDESSLQTLARKLGDRLLAGSRKVATAESCTGGWIAKIITDIEGSSSWFEGGIVSYSNPMKQHFLAVPEKLLQVHGAVSQPVVEAMAKGALQHIDAHYSLAVSGIAGPGGGSEEKPVGTVWLAWASVDGQLQSACYHFDGDRHHVRCQTVEKALLGLESLIGC